MPVYFGLPLTLEETYRILNLDFESISNEIRKNHNLSKNTYIWCELFDFLNTYLEKQYVNIRIYTTDKGQCIFGYIIEEPSDVWNKFINIDQFIILLINQKTSFVLETQKLNANLSKVELEHMEGESTIVYYPIPYIIEYN